ncbi:MAG TPA: RHS repeat-associated core domain-containing protein, partial [Chitinophagaceae bacterium]|nr:RHS repeat-associated core domain-containing protein [Chitinophagaceae bacterium]
PVPQGTTPLFDSLTFGSRVYELPNHLQNVMVTVSDKKIGVDENGDGIVDYYVADVVSAQDYYPFGQLQPGRQYGILGRYGFNGKENDNEIKGEGNQLDYGARIYDPRLGRWLSTDPLTAEYAWQSPYAYHKNSPIVSIDWQGKGDPPYEKNNVHFVPLHDPFVAIFLRQDDVTFTSTAIKLATKDVATYSINMQQYESTNLRARANYGTGAGPYSNSDYRAIGYAVADGKVVSGRSSPQTFYFAQDAKTKKWSAGQGDAPTNSAVAFGGGIPIIINGLSYGEKNVYSSGAPADLPITGDPGAGNSKYLLQRSNSGYTQQNNKSLGKSIVAFNSKTSDFLIITQEDGIQGMSLDEIRDYVKGLGFDNALSFDGSTSATLVSNYSTIRQGGYTPQTIVAPTSRKDNSIPVGATFADVNAKETDKKQNK